MPSSPIVPVILSGGSGTRLWPLSRSRHPKQFVSGLNGQKTSLLSATLSRLSPDDGFAPPVVVCNDAHRFLVREHAAAAGAELDAVLLEPVARNTTPAIAVAALFLAQRDPATRLVVMPSDHAIEDTEAFVGTIRRAAEVAETDRIALLGIAPTEPHVGYGYIRRGDEVDGFAGAFDVEGFYEKPSVEVARGYLEDGRYLWNGGIFVFRADTFLDDLARHNPAVLAAARAALEEAKEDLGFLRLGASSFATSPDISVDHAVMEKTDKAVVLPMSVGWSDLGSWNSLWETAPRDADNNFIQGDTLIEDTSGCYIRSETALISTIGVKDLVIVETPDTILIADKFRSQEVTKLVRRLKAAGRTEHEQHVKNYRPWGFFETLNVGSRFQVKLLHVKPGGVLSMQMHHHRSEHWVVVQGTAKVTIDGTEKLVGENESVYITATHWHRLENPGKVPLELIEVQLGTYLGEDDIIRSDDIYNRSDKETR